MGSSGQKSRKGKQRRHLAKVGTNSSTSQTRARERAVMGNMGLGHTKPWIRVTAMACVVALVVGAIGSLLLLLVVH